ncbi:hypothetical protein [Georgenia sp. SUBG003]|uniref:hypothetical protein n=1 Tax=Georgenia sp. SUBG003 TaxID=1497974 RepID=UPI003AB7B7F2
MVELREPEPGDVVLDGLARARLDLLVAPGVPGRGGPAGTGVPAGAASLPVRGVARAAAQPGTGDAARALTARPGEAAGTSPPTTLET